MQVSDLAAVSALGIASKASWGYDEGAMEIFAEELTLTEPKFNELTAAWVAVMNDTIVGYASLIARTKTKVELEHMFVAPSHFGQGVGSALFQKALSHARAKGFREFMLISDPNAVGFYRKLGAQEIGQHQSRIAGRSIPIMSVEIRS